jgi:multiple sugar transport system ATP-binding protein
MTMASRIAVINKGTLQQLDTPQVLYDTPANMFVAGFIGSPAMNFFPATIKKDGGNLFVDSGAFAVKIPENRVAPYQKFADKKVVFGIRPEDIHNPQFLPPAIHAENVNCKVDVIEMMGNETYLYLVANTQNFVARVDPRTTFRVGDQPQVAFNMDKFHIFDPETEQAIR